MTTLTTFPKTAQTSPTDLTQGQEVGCAEQHEVNIHVLLALEKAALFSQDVPNVHSQRRSESEEHERTVEFVMVLAVSVQPGEVDGQI